MDRQAKEQYILEQQEQNASLEGMALALNTTPKAIRSFMGRLGYSSKNNKFSKIDSGNTNNIKNDPTNEIAENTKSKSDGEGIEQLTLAEVNTTKTRKSKNTTTKEDNSNKGIIHHEDEVVTPKVEIKYVAEKSKERGKLQTTSEYDDMVKELLDWYLSVKDLPQLKHKITKKNKTVILDDILIEEPLNKKIKTDKEIWEELTRLSINSGIDVNELLTQAIKNYLKDYKHLI